MSPQKLVAVLRALRPEEHAASSDYARRVRIEWRVLCALERAGAIKPMFETARTRAELLEEAFRIGNALPATAREPHGFVIVVDADARGEHDTAV